MITKVGKINTNNVQKYQKANDSIHSDQKAHISISESNLGKKQTKNHQRNDSIHSKSDGDKLKTEGTALRNANKQSEIQRKMAVVQVAIDNASSHHGHSIASSRDPSKLNLM